MPPKKPRATPAKRAPAHTQTLSQLKKQRTTLDRKIRKLEKTKKTVKKPAAAKKGKTKARAGKKKATPEKKKPATSKKKPTFRRRAKVMPSERPERIAMPLPKNFIKN